MHKRRITRWEVKLGWALILAVVVITWRMGVHNARRMQRWQDRQEQDIRVDVLHEHNTPRGLRSLVLRARRMMQDAADRAAGIIPIEDLVEEEYE